MKTAVVFVLLVLCSCARSYDCTGVPVEALCKSGPISDDMEACRAYIKKNFCRMR